MRTPPIPALPSGSQEPILCAFEAQRAPAVTPSEVLRLPERKELRPRVEYYYRQLKALPRRLRRTLQRRYARSLAGVALLLALGQLPALAATIEVDGTSCTVVDAIKSAETDTPVGGCPAGNGADMLVLVANSTHTLTTVEDRTFGPNGLPVVTSQITIAGHDSTIERGAGAPEFRILAVLYGNLTLQGLTLSGGEAVAVSDVSDSGSGGGVFTFSGTLTLTNSTVSGNTAADGGGVFNRGTLTLTNSTVSGNSADAAGGLHNEGTVTLSNSAVLGNSADGSGGGLFNYGGSLTLTGSTVSGNSASGGGGLSNGGYGSLTLTDSTVSGNSAVDGGGLSNGGYGSLTLTDSTVSGNSARFGGGGLSNGDYGRLTLTNSTVSGNTAGNRGGGVYNSGFYYSDDTGYQFRSGTLSLAHSLTSGNTAPSSPEVHNYTGPHGSATVFVGNFNLFGTNGDEGIVGFTPGPTDIVPNVPLADILGPLADNGGPTQTHALVFGSPAIDASPLDESCSLTDQRGVFRPQGQRCDIGAFEVGVEPNPFASPTPTAGCTVNGVPDQPCRGTARPDRIVGTTGNDVIVGLAGNDHLNGSRGDDRVFGGEGNDRLIGSKGDDQLFGEGGDDDLRGLAGDDVLEGGDGNDRLKGHEGNDQLRGGDGDDALRGLEGQDTLEGGNGSDLLRGGGDPDTLNGGPGADRLVGGGGIDRCTSDAEDNIVVLCE